MHLRVVLHRSLTTTETDSRQVCCKNAKALQLSIEELERLAMQKETARAKAA